MVGKARSRAAMPARSASKVQPVPGGDRRHCGVVVEQQALQLVGRVFGPVELEAVRLGIGAGEVFDQRRHEGADRRAGQRAVLVHPVQRRGAVRGHGEVVPGGAAELHSHARRAGGHHLQPALHPAVPGSPQHGGYAAALAPRQPGRLRRRVGQAGVEAGVRLEARRRRNPESPLAPQPAVEQAPVTGAAVDRRLACAPFGSRCHHGGCGGDAGGAGHVGDAIQHRLHALDLEELRHHRNAEGERCGRHQLFTIRNPGLERANSVR